VWLGGLGAIVARSVCGVKAKAGRPAIALLAGVVAGLAVVRSLLSTQVASTIWPCNRANNWSHRPAAAAGECHEIERTSAATPPHPARRRESIRPSPLVIVYGNASNEGA